MRNPFKKTPAAPTFLKARDMYTFAVHLEDASGVVFCRRGSALSGQYETTAQEVVKSAHLQHDGWYWCPTCASAVTDKDPEFFREAHRNSGK